jgi:hypothetical protein
LLISCGVGHFTAPYEYGWPFRRDTFLLPIIPFSLSSSRGSPPALKSVRLTNQVELSWDDIGGGDYILEVTDRLGTDSARGVFIEFDSLGWQPAEDNTLIAAIKELLAAGQETAFCFRTTQAGINLASRMAGRRSLTLIFTRRSFLN